MAAVVIALSLGSQALSVAHNLELFVGNGIDDGSRWDSDALVHARRCACAGWLTAWEPRFHAYLVRENMPGLSVAGRVASNISFEEGFRVTTSRAEVSREGIEESFRANRDV